MEELTELLCSTLVLISMCCVIYIYKELVNGVIAIVKRVIKEMNND